MKKLLLAILLIGFAFMPIQSKVRSDAKKDIILSSKNTQAQIKINTYVTAIKDPSEISASKPPIPTPVLEIPNKNQNTAKVSENTGSKNAKVNPNATQVKRTEAQTYTTEQIKEKICAVFGGYCADALLIALKESGYRQYAVSKTNDYGIFQLNCRWQGKRVGGDCTKFFNVDLNIQLAYKIFTEWGYSWRAWTTCKYLPRCY